TIPKAFMPMGKNNKNPCLRLLFVPIARPLPLIPKTYKNLPKTQNPPCIFCNDMLKYFLEIKTAG
ncbi:MAG: hypothetical protein K2O14_00415, partial [Oscillospiraceae bacterium]|nr:hypothetical protein [Oscillospiraceae bacterium]